MYIFNYYYIFVQKFPTPWVTVTVGGNNLGMVYDAAIN